jgi:hypothetical protein
MQGVKRKKMMPEANRTSKQASGVFLFENGKKLNITSPSYGVKWIE